MYCFNSNPQSSNQFATYPNYHHEQFLHHHYPQYAATVSDEHHYIPYETNYPAGNERQENIQTFPSANNDLYEFLPEEIFQLDQPIIKSEATIQSFNNTSNNNTTPTLYESSNMPAISYANPITQNFDSVNGINNEMHSGNSNNYIKYTSAASNNYLEINNNSNFNNGSATVTNPSSDDYHQRVVVSSKDIDLYNYHITATEPASSSEKIRKHTTNFFQTNPAAEGSKRDNSLYFFQQSPAYYIPDVHSVPNTINKTSSNDFINRSVEKYNNFIVNH